MKAQLLVATWSPSCRRAQEIWHEVATELDLDLETLDVAQSEGQQLMRRLKLKTIPALLIDGTLVAIGVQSEDEARKIVAAAQKK